MDLYSLTGSAQTNHAASPVKIAHLINSNSHSEKHLGDEYSVSIFIQTSFFDDTNTHAQLDSRAV
jgi:hypothetical protein